VIKEILVRRANKAVLFATHDLDEAEELSDRVVLMVAGKIDRLGTFAELKPRLDDVFREEAAEEEAEWRRLFPEEASA
jgi:ABC-type multidrug transport system ATPase subunit